MALALGDAFLKHLGLLGWCWGHTLCACDSLTCDPGMETNFQTTTQSGGMKHVKEEKLMSGGGYTVPGSQGSAHRLTSLRLNQRPQHVPGETGERTVRSGKAAAQVHPCHLSKNRNVSKANLRNVSQWYIHCCLASCPLH